MNSGDAVFWAEISGGFFVATLNFIMPIALKVGHLETGVIFTSLICEFFHSKALVRKPLGKSASKECERKAFFMFNVYYQ